MTHEEELFDNMINYLCMVWDILREDEIISNFKNLGFTDEDIKKYVCLEKDDYVDYVLCDVRPTYN